MKIWDIMVNTDGTFSSDIRDNQKDIFDGKLPQNLNFQKQKWKIILNNQIEHLKRKENQKSKI